MQVRRTREEALTVGGHRIKLIIFDFDGVLIQNHGKLKFPGYLLRQINHDIIWPDDYHFKSTDWAKELLKLDLFADYSKIEREAVMKKFSLALFRFQISQNNISPYDCVFAILPRLAQKASLAILSNNCSEAIKFYLGQELIKFFSTVLTYECLENLKPSPEGVDSICHTLKIKAEETLLIGDNAEDYIAADDAGRRGAKFMIAGWNRSEKTKDLIHLYESGKLSKNTLGVLYGQTDIINAFKL